MHQRQHHLHHYYTLVDNTVLVSDNACSSGRSPPSAPLRFKNEPTIQAIKSSPSVSEASTFSSHSIGQSLAQFDLQ